MSSLVMLSIKSLVSSNAHDEHVVKGMKVFIRLLTQEDLPVAATHAKAAVEAGIIENSIVVMDKPFPSSDKSKLLQTYGWDIVPSFTNCLGQYESDSQPSCDWSIKAC